MINTGRYINQDAGNSQQFEIRLGAGKNLYEIVQNISTVVPPGFEIYMGCDPQNVPAGILGDRNDLAIHVTSGMRMVQLSVKYFDTITGTYVGPITPRNFILTSDQEWGLWKDFSDIVIPHSSIITVLAAGCSCSCGGSGNNPGGGSGDVDVSVTVGSTTTLPAGQPAEVYNSGTNKNVVLNFRIPQGHQGIPGKSAYQVAVDNGFNGTEQEWLESLKGSGTGTGGTGTPGKDGKDGKSAYEIAVAHGFQGTEEDWLASLKGPQGPQGIQGIQGIQGPQGLTGAAGSDGADGADGKSAYQIAVDSGFSGSEQEWLNSLKGQDGHTPVKGTDYFTEYEISEVARRAADMVDVGNVSIDQISPDKVIFTEDVLTSYAVGNIKLTNGIGKLAEAGDSLSDMLEKVWLKETNPTTSQPVVSITLDQAGSYEVGTYVSPTYAASCTTGSYSYGSKATDGSIIAGTGVSITGWSITDTNSNSATTAKGSFSKFQVVDGVSYTITANATHTAGNTPVTNLKNDYVAGKISAGTKSKTSSAVTGYRNSFYGTTDNKDALTNASVRALTKSGKALANGETISVSVPVGSMRVVVAYPATLRDLTSIKDVNGLNAEILSGFTKSSMDITGNESYNAISYKLYTMEFASANDKANTYTVVI